MHGPAFGTFGRVPPARAMMHDMSFAFRVGPRKTNPDLNSTIYGQPSNNCKSRTTAAKYQELMCFARTAGSLSTLLTAIRSGLARYSTL